MAEPITWYEGAALTDRRTLHADERGSIIATSNASGTATPYTYGAYGEPNTWTGPRFRYTGQATLPEVQLYHYKARVYDPHLGRFLQTDPVGYEDDVNLYAYVKNDPLNSIDPTGMTDFDCSGGLGTGNCTADAVLADGDTIQGADGNTYTYNTSGNGDYTVTAATRALAQPRNAVSAGESGNDVVVRYSNGTQDIRSGGTRSWRNNNPGNIRGGAFATSQGAIGTAARFGVFPDEATGMKALDTLLQAPTYQALSVADAIARYAPPNENNTGNYQQFVQQMTGIAGNAPMNTLTPGQRAAVAAAITRMEGWQTGNVARTLQR